MFTLLVRDHDAHLWDDAGNLLANLDRQGPNGWAVAGEGLRAVLPAKAPVQLIFAGSRLNVLCQDSPRLNPREQAEVQQRLAGNSENSEPQNTAHALDADPQAEGGHVLWMASQPRSEMDELLDALKETGARPVFAMPWQRAFLGTAKQELPSAVYLTLAAGVGNLLFFRGRSLSYTRTFPVPPEMDPQALSDPEVEALCHLAQEELARHLQFIRQKHRGLALTNLFTVGLPEAHVPAMATMGQTLGLTAASLGPSLPAFLLAGAERERRRKGSLDLIPPETRAPAKQRMSRALVWTAGAGLVLIGLGAQALFFYFESALGREAVRAEAARDSRKVLTEAAAQASRQRFGLLRLRQAEQRQGRAMQQLEELGLRIFQVPAGVELQKVQISQAPGNALAHRFTADGVAITRQGFSMGTMADYFKHLTGHPGMRLDPLKEVTVMDSSETGLSPEHALTRFRLEGTAP